MDNWEQQAFRTSHHQIASTFWQHETTYSSISQAPSHQVMGKIFRPFPIYKFQAKQGLPEEAGELWQDIASSQSLWRGLDAHLSLFWEGFHQEFSEAEPQTEQPRCRAA